MNVLSLFDGMSCGMIALDRLGIKVDNYYASEIDKYAMQVSAANYPEIIQVGDITKLDLSTLPKIDLVMGGSPCQGFSVAGKGLAFDDPRSALFFEFVKCVNELKPKYFLLENVNMKKEWLQVINEYMGVEGIKINSALVSAQNRQRWYWTNIPTIKQPEQRGIVLSDILENDAEEPMYSNIYGGFGEKKPREHYEKSVTIRANSGGGSIPNVKIKDFDKNLDKMTTKEGKAYALTASYNGAVAWNSIEKKQRSMVPVVKAMTEVRTPEANQIRYEHKRKTGKDWSPRHMRHLVERPDEKMNTLTGSLTKQHILQITKEENKVSWRKLTPIECERLQTVPDNYTNHVSNTQRYKMLGNGWTIEVIAHILQNMEIEQ
jgi:DNA (cytosine-5)-methyltransferase 3A